MRCRAGDLAIVTNPREPFEPLLGRPVRVVAHVVIDGEDCWSLEEPQEFVFRAPGVWVGRGCGEIRAGDAVVAFRLPDSWLTPLRGYGAFDNESVSDVREAARAAPAEAAQVIAGNQLLRGALRAPLARGLAASGAFST